MRRALFLLLISSLFLSSVATAFAGDIVVYSNTTSSTGRAFDNGTLLLADDLAMTHAGALDDFTFCMTFFGPAGSILTAFTADIVFFDNQGPNGGPGNVSRDDPSLKDRSRSYPASLMT